MAGFEVRALGVDEREDWLDLLEHAFAYKGVARTFFASHVTHDPWFQHASVRVCVDTAAEPAPRLVSAVRVYRRRMHVDGGSILVGAIGDGVCVRACVCVRVRVRECVRVCVRVRVCVCV